MPAKTHGLSSSPAYWSWQAMKKRCLDPRNDSYEYYGGRGITICKRWMKFENFYEDMGPRPNGMTLDRIDTDSNYCPENCQWGDQYTQLSTRRAYRRRDSKGYIRTKGGRFRAYICLKNPGKSIIKRIGLYDTEEEAHQAWLKACEEHA
jgi:hypothetical protein